jgi:hypothetical protein
VHERKRRLDVLEAVLGERERPEEGRPGAERVNRRADVVDEPGQGELGRSRPATDRLGRLADEDGPARPRERDRSGEPVRPRSDDDRVVA